MGTDQRIWYFWTSNQTSPGDSFEFEHDYDEALEGESVDAQGKIVKKSYSRFVAYLGSTPGRVRVLVQGDGPDGNTVSAKKDVKVIGVPNPD